MDLHPTAGTTHCIQLRIVILPDLADRYNSPSAWSELGSSHGGHTSVKLSQCILSSRKLAFTAHHSLLLRDLHRPRSLVMGSVASLLLLGVDHRPETLIEPLTQSL